MILFKRVGESFRHIEDREWLLLFLETVGVLVGILLAFELQEWASRRADAAKHREIMDRLFEESEQDVASLRDLRDVLLVMVPIVLAAVVTVGATVLISMPFNYANIIALPLLVGLGVDNGIHVVHRMRTDSVAQLFDTSTMRAVLASALTTVASFGNLAFSSHVGTSSMGILLALGLAISMSATLIALPAWLNTFARARPAH